MIVAWTLTAQEPVRVGGASYAAYPPPYKSQTAEHTGFQATRMLTRKLYVDETAGRPIPTNDWWTDLIVSQFSGAMWSYPAMIHTSAEGVRVSFPTRWSDNGTEVLSDSHLTVGGIRFRASEARAVGWHDWDVVAELPSASGFGSVRATLVHGSPFTWVEFNGVTPEIAFSQSPTVEKRDAGSTLVKIGSDYYGLFYSADAQWEQVNGAVRLDGAGWLSVAPLAKAELYEMFKPYASSIVRNTKVGWQYDEKSSLLSTTWAVEAENLRSPGAEAPVIQGFLPHAYKHAVQSQLDFADGADYLTPRGTLRLATSAEGTFSYAYRFYGMLPYYAAPSDAGYDPELMRQLIEEYANGGAFGDDTYWGGKGLTQMALNMTFAKQTGNADAYERSKSKLRGALTDWLTYSPGENTKFFAYYPRWGGMLGFDVSYDSDAFNDHHFHYGYFIYAAALLCLEDADFARDYGELLRMIVKDYANYDREDTRFPFLRTLDIWAGHSYAGGLGDHGNDNGNGQESSSEAMQGWGGVYLLGVALGDGEMRDAGIFGWMTESRGVAEYWFDRDRTNYDYTKYEHPYNTNLTSKGIGWWTWFSGDPLWMHSIQWMPVSPCLNYLSEDREFVKWDYERMMSNTAYKWFDGKEPLAQQSVGNVVLAYMERYDPERAAEIFDEARDRGMGIAKNVDTGHISYYVIHNHLTYGDIDISVTADCPTANCYVDTQGKETFIVLNPDSQAREVTFRRDGKTIRTVKAPAGMMTAFSAPAVASRVELRSSEGFMLPPGSATNLSAVVFDQYGAEVQSGNVSFKATGAASIVGGRLTVASSAARGSKIAVTAEADGLSVTEEFTVNDKPVVRSARMLGVPEFIEVNTEMTLAVQATDQYGTVTEPEVRWTVDGAPGSPVISFDRPGKHSVRAEADGISLSEEITVLPELHDVARGCKASASSQENVGTAPENAVDGDGNTRWGSEHSDSQWFRLDLGKRCKITSVTIDWETAYAADYDIEVSSDGNEWLTMFRQRGLSAPGKVRHPISAACRYIRINCLRRATQYGYSIIEMTVGGVDAAAASNTPVGIDIDAPAVMMEGEATVVAASAFTLGGTEVTATDVKWSSTPAGTFAAGKFTPSTYGRHTLTAKSGALTATRDVLVEESIKLASMSVSPAASAVLTGDETVIVAEGMNQFGGVFELNPDEVKVDVAPEGATYDVATGVFRADRRGDYTLTFNGGMAIATVSVRDVSEANLAAGKEARASSSVGGNTPDKAVDLDTETRWESAQADGQWIAVDLGEPFVVDKVRIRWEGAYAKEYAVETSLDGDNWFSAVSVTDGRGGTEEVELPSIPASAVRVFCLKRATAYGTSLYELEVYGLERYAAENPGMAPKILAIDTETGNGSVSGSVQLESDAFVTVTILNSSNREIGRVRGFGDAVEFAFDGLTSDTYRLRAEASDAFGNVAVSEKTVEVEYSLEGVNIALGKPAAATSAENGALSAGNAVDGDVDTRWGSEFNDGESLTVDLVDTYLLDRVRIVWNQPAYATDYLVETSEDGDTFSKLFERTNHDGSVDDAKVSPVRARYVRVTGLRRATQYGTSINELEVYATEMFSGLRELVVNCADTVHSFDLSGRPVPGNGRGVVVRSDGTKRLNR